MEDDAYCKQEITNIMMQHGCVNQNTIEVISKDEPAAGDLIYQFEDLTDANKWRMHCKKTHMGAKRMHWELFKLDENGQWEKMTYGSQPDV